MALAPLLTTTSFLWSAKPPSCKNPSSLKPPILARRFLKSALGKHAINTAHHADDLLETIIINFLRGTGWRGLAPFSSPDIERPLLTSTKNHLRTYAAEHQVTYREDPTNHEDNYLRNRVRTAITSLSPTLKSQLLELSKRQTALRHELEQTLSTTLPADHFYPRAWFLELDDTLALEILRSALARVNISVTRPTLQEFLAAIRTYAPGKQFNLPGDRLVKMHKDHFML